MAAIPFLIEDACGGLAQCHGLIRDEGETLVIEYQTQDAIAGVIKGEVQEVRIPVKEIASIQVKKSWLGWSDKLAIQMASMKQVANVPTMKQAASSFPSLATASPSPKRSSAVCRRICTKADMHSRLSLRESSGSASCHPTRADLLSVHSLVVASTNPRNFRGAKGDNYEPSTSCISARRWHRK